MIITTIVPVDGGWAIEMDNGITVDTGIVYRSVEKAAKVRRIMVERGIVV